jgi:PQQ-dependent catabolism-associated CXXCW motif protein
MSAATLICLKCSAVGGRSVRRRAIAVVALLLLSAGLAGVGSSGVRSEVVAEPDGYKASDYRSKVPATLKGARVVTAREAAALRDAGGDKPALFIDVYPRPPKPANLPAGTVWRDPRHATIVGAQWLPNVGYGVLAPEPEAYLKASLEQLTAGDKARTLVFFCLKDCWMSWNAAKRAMALGYGSVVWFPDGTDGWQEIGRPLQEAEPLP